MEDPKMIQAIETCKMFVNNNASIQVVRDDMVDSIDLGGISFHSYDTSSIEYLLNKIRDDQILLKSLEKSDASKEQSSMTYYNAMKEYKDKFEFMRDVVDIMADFIVESMDNNFHNKYECKDYFKGKVRDRGENRNK